MRSRGESWTVHDGVFVEWTRPADNALSLSRGTIFCLPTKPNLQSASHHCVAALIFIILPASYIAAMTAIVLLLCSLYTISTEL